MNKDIGSVTEQAEREQNERFRFISRSQISNHYEYIPIPDQPQRATLLRTKGRYVNFYRGQEPEGSTNGWSTIPDDVSAVCFPDYRPVSGKYGKPQFIKY